MEGFQGPQLHHPDTFRIGCELVQCGQALFGEVRLNSCAVQALLAEQGLAALNQLASDAEGVRVVQLRALKALQRLNAG